MLYFTKKTDMNFEKIKVKSFLLLLLIISSCNTIKLNNLTNEQDLSKEIEVVHLISEKDKISHNGKKIGDIVFKDNKNPDWNYLKNKMTAFAKLNGANLIEIKTFGWGKKGQVFYLEANLFYVENEKKNLNTENNKDERCSIVIFRDGLESPLGSAFTINASINNTKFENLKKSNYFREYVDDCNQENTVLINKNSYKVKLNGKSKYYKVAKQTGTGYLGNSVQIGIGGVYFVEIEDEVLGKLLISEINE